jgi:signal transduction histidine kinase
MQRWSISSSILLGGGYCVAVLLLDWLSNIGLYRGLGVTPWTPASGLAVAFSYFFGLQAALPIALAEILVLVFTSAVPMRAPSSALVVVSSTVVWLAGGEALRRLPDFEPRMGTVQAVGGLIVVGLCQAVAISCCYLLALWTSGLVDGGNAFPIAWRLVVGHLVGILVVAPLPMMLRSGLRVPKTTFVRLLQGLTLFLTLWVIFQYRAASAYQLFYLLFLPLLWVALRDGIFGSAIMLNLAQVGIIIGSQMRTDIDPGTGSLQILMIALALTGLLVGAVVTERQAAGQRLRDQQAALGRALRLRSAGETAAAIAHQINQPITAISTYASVVRDALERNDRELARSSLEKLSAECDRAAAVTRSIRDLVKQGTLSKSAVRIQELAEATRKVHAAECAELDITLAVEAPAGLPPVPADPVQLEQAFDNLVTNSVESIRDAGRGSSIRIAVSVKDAECIIEVEDDGPGFAPGLEDLATTPFMTTKHNGSGLGLAIARSVAEAHGGSLAIINRSSGALVRLRLPTSGTVT